MDASEASGLLGATALEPESDTVDDIDIAVALARLDTKMTLMLDEQKKVTACQSADHDRILMLESTARVNTNRIADLEGTRRALTWESRIEALIVAALAAWGIVK